MTATVLPDTCSRCIIKRFASKVETHLLDTGHFALETHGEEIASRIEKFLLRPIEPPLRRRIGNRLSGPPVCKEQEKL